MMKSVLDALRQARDEAGRLHEQTDCLMVRLDGLGRSLGKIIGAMETEALAEEALEGGEPEPEPPRQQGAAEEKHAICIRKCDGSARYWNEKTRQWQDEKPAAAGPGGEMDLDFY